ncbi:MAG: M56 family metallopeptidase, partial [Pirellulaceae bacterium]|nr:M56 family metallopeptidase [Pirellulaceae bacterium]
VSSNARSISPAQWVLLIWGAGVLLIAGRFALSQVVLHRLAAKCTEVEDRAVISMSDSLRELLGIGEPVRILVSDRRTMPMTWGVVRPQLLLPAEAADWPDSRMRSVLLHELGHIQRRDSLIQVIVESARAIHWLNPLVWVAAWRLSVEREAACDDLVLRSGVKPSEYAADVLDIAIGCGASGTAGAAPMARTTRIQSRIRAILSERIVRTTASRRVLLLTGCSCLLLSTPLAMMRAGDERAELKKNDEPKKNDERAESQKNAAAVVSAGNGFAKVVTQELEVGGRTARLSLDSGKLLPATGDLKPTSETWRDEDGKQVELVPAGDGLALAFYNISALQTGKPWSKLSPLQLWGALGGRFDVFRGNKFAVHRLDFEKLPYTFLLDSGKLQVDKSAVDDAAKLKVSFTFIAREGRSIVVQGAAPGDRKGRPLKWGQPLGGLVAAHEIVAPDGGVEYGEEVKVRHYIRNVGKSTEWFDYHPVQYAGLWLVDEKGKWRPHAVYSKTTRAPMYKVVLDPGEQWVIGGPGELEDFGFGRYILAVGADNDAPRPYRLAARPVLQPGKHRVRFTLPLRKEPPSDPNVFFEIAERQPGATAPTTLLVKENNVDR